MNCPSLNYLFASTKLALPLALLLGENCHNCNDCCLATGEGTDFIYFQLFLHPLSGNHHDFISCTVVASFFQLSQLFINRWMLCFSSLLKG